MADQAGTHQTTFFESSETRFVPIGLAQNHGQSSVDIPSKESV